MSGRPRRDGHVLLALAVVCAILVAGLAVVSRGTPSAAQYDSVALQTPEITADEGCSNFATFWTVDTGVNVPIEAIEWLTNCRLSADGEWFVPDGAEDPRLSDRSVLTAEEQARVEAFRSLLMADLFALDQALPNSSWTRSRSTTPRRICRSSAIRSGAGWTWSQACPVSAHCPGVPAFPELGNHWPIMSDGSSSAGPLRRVSSRRLASPIPISGTCSGRAGGMRNEFGVTLIPIFGSLMTRC